MGFAIVLYALDSLTKRKRDTTRSSLVSRKVCQWSVCRYISPCHPSYHPSCFPPLLSAKSIGSPYCLRACFCCRERATEGSFHESPAKKCTERMWPPCFRVMEPRKHSTVIQRDCVGREGFLLLTLKAEREKGGKREGWHSNATTTDNERAIQWVMVYLGWVTRVIRLWFTSIFAGFCTVFALFEGILECGK